MLALITSGLFRSAALQRFSFHLLQEVLKVRETCEIEYKSRKMPEVHVQKESADKILIESDKFQKIIELRKLIEGKTKFKFAVSRRQITI